MVTAMQDDRYNWRTIERLAIESGVEEDEARQILTEHPEQVVLGKSHEGRLLARLANRQICGLQIVRSRHCTRYWKC